jgi:hypothetical protein
VAVDKANGKVRDKFSCTHCGSELRKTDCDRAQVQYFDKKLNEMVMIAKQVPVAINYSATNLSNGRITRFEKEPDENDLALIDKIDAMDIPYWYPTDRMCEGSESRRNDRYGITHVHQFFTRSAMYEMAMYWHLTEEIENNRKQRRSATVAVIKLMLWLMSEKHWKGVRNHATEETWT